MAVEVVDTNVWVNMDKIPPDSESERQCVLACIQWGADFNRGTADDQIAVDSAWKILTEYRRNIKRGGLAERYLNAILSQPITCLKLVKIEFDKDGFAILTDTQLVADPSDRKFVAVSLAFQPPAPIVNATDTDWEKSKTKLNKVGIQLKELCPKYIAEKLKH